MTQTTTIKPTRAQKRSTRLADPDHVSGFKIFTWAGAGLSAAVNFIVLGWLMLYGTDTLGLAPAAIGGVIAASQVFNAVGGLVAAYIVDRSPETKLGKDRLIVPAYGKAFQAAIAGSQLVMVPRAAHLVPQEQPAAVIDALARLG